MEFEKVMIGRRNQAGIRGFIEDVRKLCWRARNSTAPEPAGYQLLTSEEQAILLHRLSFLERWARNSRRQLTGAKAK